MASFILPYFLASAAYATAAPWAPGTPPHNTRSPQRIQWSPCGDLGFNETVPLSCGSLTVPLDYTEPDSRETLDLQILRIPALKQLSKGNAFFNFGGLGASGIGETALQGDILRLIVGGSYDIVDVIPRGTGDTLPFSCYTSHEERAVLILRTPPATNRSDTALGEIWAESKLTADACFYAQNATGSFIGTAFTARIMSVVDAVEEDSMLRYWGISYGTLLGSMLIAMFPNRVDRALLDGVINAHEYYDVDVNQVADADGAFSGFCAQCVDNRDRCPIAGNQTAAELEEDIYGALETLKHNPIPISVDGKGIIVTYTTIKGMIYQALYFPVLWPALGQKLDILFSGNAAGVVPELLAPAPSTPDAEAIIGIKCSDNLAPEKALDEVLPGVKARRALSRMGGDIADVSALQCARWECLPRRGTQNYPNTPLVSAKNKRPGFEGSVVLEQAGYGHTMFSQASLCTVKAAVEYFEKGTLPEPGTVCEVDAAPFSEDDRWTAVIEGLAMTG